MKQSDTPVDPAKQRDTAQSGKAQLIPWHPAFVEAIQLELLAYKDVLEFRPEYQLTSEPLRIDCVVIKKEKDAVIEKNIAAIFREVNLLEYKSPDHYVSVEDFYKVYGYACLYASLEKVPVTNLTISFVESHYPNYLIEHLKRPNSIMLKKHARGFILSRVTYYPSR